MSGAEQSQEAQPRPLRYSLPGVVSWSLIVIISLGVALFPERWMVVSIVFLTYFMGRMLVTLAFAMVGELRRRAWEKRDWEVDEGIPGPGGIAPGDVWHVVLLPNYTESEPVLIRTLDALAVQKRARERLILVLAMEAREQGAQEKGHRLAERYRDAFARVLVTVHPAGLEGETAGKGSNQAWAARVARTTIDEMRVAPDRVTVTSCDADSLFHHEYFAALSHLFAHSRDRYERFWQAPLFYCNNIWRVPAPIRFTSWFSHVGQLAELTMPFYPALPVSTYSTSLRLAEGIGWWDPEVISEDWHVYLQAHFHLDGRVKLEPIYLATHADCAEGDSWLDSMRTRFQQVMRHSWGAEDVGYCLGQIRSRRTLALRHLSRAWQVLFEHVMRVAAWFFMLSAYFLALGAHPRYAGVFERFVSRDLPGIGLLGLLFSVGGFAIVVTVIVELVRTPPTPDVSWFKVAAEFLVMWSTLPLVGMYLGMLPALHAQTLLMLRRPFSFIVTPKRAGAFEAA